MRSQSTRGTRKSGSPAKFSRELRGRGGLEPQIHLEPDHFGERLHHLDRLEPAQRRLQPLGQAGEPQEQVEVAGKRLGDARAATP